MDLVSQEEFESGNAAESKCTSSLLAFIPHHKEITMEN